MFSHAAPDSAPFLKGMFMKQVILCAAVLLGLFATLAPAQAATPPLVSVTCSAGVTGCAFALDDQFPPEGQQWQDQTAWWTGFNDSVTYQLDSTYMLTGLTVSLDNNDSYLIEASVDGNTWDTVLFVGAPLGSVFDGMDTFSTIIGNPFFDANLSFTPAMASQIRITSVDGDTLNSVGELQVTAVPEPATWLLMASGLALVGLRRHRRIR